MTDSSVATEPVAHWALLGATLQTRRHDHHPPADHCSTTRPRLEEPSLLHTVLRDDTVLVLCRAIRTQPSPYEDAAYVMRCFAAGARPYLCGTNRRRLVPETAQTMATADMLQRNINCRPPVSSFEGHIVSPV